MAKKMPRGWRRIYHVRRPLQPYRAGNSIRGVKRAARKGYQQIDLDANITRDGAVVICHWPKFAKDRFRDPTHRWDKNTKIADLTLRQVSRLRAPGRYRILTVETMLAACARYGLVACIEVKGDPRFQSDETMRQIKHAASVTGAQVRIMTLQNLGPANAPALRLRAAKRAGFTTILLARGRKPRNYYAVWDQYIDYVRGRWR